MLIDHFQRFEFNTKLKTWYQQHHRPLPWRATTDPYKIWLSEIILQQTRVAQGTPYYLRFLDSYPTVFDLASAEEKDVLRLWQGLGYYSRARNMHLTARQVVNEFGGVFPGNAATLSRLKGLGNYTAAAIASFSYGEMVPAVDGNVYRLLSRLFGIFTDILSNEGKKEFLNVARQLIPENDPGLFNQAMIEFGALQCVPGLPDCTVCPFTYMCHAFIHGVQNQLPVKTKKGTVKNRYLNYIVVEHRKKLAMRERVQKDIWKGLYDFYLIESKNENAFPEELVSDRFFAEWLAVGTIKQIPKLYTHLLTHQRLNVQFWWLYLPDGAGEELPENMQFYSIDEIEVLPKPILMDQMLKEENFL